jgi:hypothetical protein
MNTKPNPTHLCQTPSSVLWTATLNGMDAWVLPLVFGIFGGLALLFGLGLLINGIKR